MKCGRRRGRRMREGDVRMGDEGRGGREKKKRKEGGEKQRGEKRPKEEVHRLCPNKMPFPPSHPKSTKSKGKKVARLSALCNEDPVPVDKITFFLL